MGKGCHGEQGWAGGHWPGTLQSKMSPLALTCPPARPSAPRFPPLRCCAGLLDFYVFSPLSRLLGPKFTEKDFTLRDRLGGGNYGQGACLPCRWCM